MQLQQTIFSSLIQYCHILLLAYWTVSYADQETNKFGATSLSLESKGENSWNLTGVSMQDEKELSFIASNRQGVSAGRLVGRSLFNPQPHTPNRLTGKMFRAVESERCLKLSSRKHSPYPDALTEKFMPRAFSLLDTRYYHKSPDIPEAYKLPCFENCALVGSSGTLKNSSFGKTIDSYPCIIRMNSAPTYRHETDVGRRTTVRIMHDSHITERNLAEMLRMDPGGLILVWPSANKPKGLAGPGPRPENTRRLAFWLAYAKSSTLLTRYSPAAYYDSHKMARRVVAPYPPHVPSTGWNALYAALHFCKHISVFGYSWELSSERGSRQTGQSRGIGKAYYWYKNARGDVSEFDYYFRREIKNPRSYHRFAEEKQAFRNLAKVFNITFY
mmetsp:Transcript_37848/g.89882  ORF Transcript_37848/g.89882 Transcript_37848/m.89882 type:complete len:387 (+) Transcript_37848:69-1229(+)